jgi:ATP-dependent RNA helicase DeaD
VAALQGNLSQNARDRVMADFRSGAVPILVATNVAARGLDVSHVERVINVELPESPELLTHRIGRTGRMGRQGQAITLLGPEDLTKWRRLERGFTRPIRRAPWRGAAIVTNGNGNGHENGHAADAPPATAPVTVAAAVPARRTARAQGQRPTPSTSATPRREHAPRRERPAARDAAPELDGRELLKRYGRDPRRPVWADAARGRTGAEPNGGAPERRTRRRHQSVCASCGGTAETTFRPDPARPVYCDGCYRAVRETRSEVATAVS